MHKTTLPIRTKHRKIMAYRLWWISLLLSAALLLPGLANATPAPDSTKSANLWAQLGQSHWIPEGKGSRIVYVISDPNCPYCSVLIKELQKQIQPLHLQVRYLLVGYLTPSSAGKAAYILQAKDPLAALLENEKKFNMEHFGGVPETLADQQSEKILAQHLAILESLGSREIPAMIYRKHRGGTPTVIQGALNAQDLRATLEQIPLS